MKLASIERIKKLSPIEGADNILVADILGYKVVVKKNEFQENDLCVYHYSDTILPQKPEYEFLRNKNFRLKTIRLKGQYSEGLALPINILLDKDSIVEGMDVTEQTGIQKYEKPVPAQLAGKVEGSFPSFLKRTDELNGRTYPDVIKELQGKESCITLKMDGSSGTFYLKDEKFGVCSRNLELKEEEGNGFWKVAREYKIEEALRAFRAKFPGDYAVQGEVYGPGIQKNPMKAEKISLALFNFFSIKHRKYADFDVFMEFCVENNLPFVPVVWAGKFNFSLEQLINMANEQEYLKGVSAEGIVCRPCKEQQSEVLGGRMSFKILSEPFAIEN